MMHWELQPSPPTALPSSHPSPLSRMPFPQQEPASVSTQVCAASPPVPTSGKGTKIPVSPLASRFSILPPAPPTLLPPAPAPTSTTPFWQAPAQETRPTISPLLARPETVRFGSENAKAIHAELGL